jgi:hypothetical protein
MRDQVRDEAMTRPGPQQKPQPAWDGLNDRQRLYLSLIFDADQEAEREMKVRSARSEKTPPAAEWRKITDDIKIPKNRQLEFGYSSIQSAPAGARPARLGCGRDQASTRSLPSSRDPRDVVSARPHGRADQRDPVQKYDEGLSLREIGELTDRAWQEVGTSWTRLASPGVLAVPSRSPAADDTLLSSPEVFGNFVPLSAEQLEGCGLLVGHQRGLQLQLGR